MPIVIEHELKENDVTIYETLKKDHTKVKELLSELIELKPEREKRRSSLIQEIRDELIPHARAEEAVLYNLIRAVDTAKGVVAHGYQEHIEAEVLLRTLQVAGSIDAGWKATAEKLRDALIHHIHEEETEIFSAAKKLFTEDETEMMSEAFEDVKAKVRDQGFIGTTKDLVMNMLPPRVSDAMNVSLKP